MQHTVALLSYLDIPEFFVQIFSDSDGVIEFFKNHNIQGQKLSMNLTVKNHGCKPIFDFDRTLCAHPWTGLHVWTDGTTSACCEINQKITDDHGSPFNVRTTKLVDIFNSQSMQQLRKDFISGKKIDACQTCWRSEEQGRPSRRTLTLYRLNTIYPEISWEGKNPIRYIGGHLTSLCNLGCRICSPFFSSTIATEQLRQLKSPKSSPVYKILKDTTWMVKDHFFDQINSLTTELQSFEFLGGEPFLFNGLFEMLNDLSARGLSQDMSFNFTTNGTKYPEIFDQDFKFKNLEVTFSIDNIGKRFEYERYHGDWNQVTSNIKKFVDLRNARDNVRLGVSVTVSIQNVLYLDELDNWIDQMGFDHRFYHLVHTHECLSITNMTEQAKNLVLTKLSGKFDYIKDIIRNSDVSDGSEFVRYMKNLDQIRNQSFLDSHPEMAKAMGY